ncbi:MAG: hypothetical protein ABSD75_26400 [Terriglobales bacterium]
MNDNLDLAAEQPSARRFRVFISYASEDFQIAEAIRKCLSLALGEVFAEINIDKRFLQPGLDFRKQIQAKLEATDVFIIAYSGTKDKESHGYTGWEVGYFDRVMQTATDRPRTKVALYLETPPAVTAEEEGVVLDIGRDKLRLGAEEFVSGVSVQPDDQMCVLLAKWQQAVDEVAKAHDLPVLERKPEQDPASCVKALKIGIFQYLKTTIDTTLKPQKQITIRATGASLQRSQGDLPDDAEIIPVGSGGSMGIFGLSDVRTTWKEFLQSTSASRYRDSWREAIASVIMSSYPDHINVDNSQIILSSDDSKTYRVILTTATKYYDDTREFNIYFVEALQRSEYGDTSTTILLKGLELVCRFRFMFLEDASQFSSGNILASPPGRIPELASRLLKELNLLRKDSRDAGLDDPPVWRAFVSWDDILKMGQEFRPREQQIRTIAGRIVEAKGRDELIRAMQPELAQVLAEMEQNLRPLNAALLKQMAAKLAEMVPECSPRLAAAS